MVCRDRNRPQRRGSMIVEVVVAATLLATAAVAVSRLARGTAVVNQQSNQHLAAVLTADNALEQLRQFSIEQLADHTESVAAELATATGYQVELQSVAFTSGDLAGQHLIARVTTAGQIVVTRHDWRWQQPQEADDE